MNIRLFMEKRGVGGWMGLIRRQSTESINNNISNELCKLLIEIIPFSVKEVGTGLEGIKRVISLYKGVGGIYLYINSEKRRVYVGSSSNISRRIREYKDGSIHNSTLKRHIRKYGWEEFRILVISIPGGKSTILRWEYKIMNLIKESGIIGLYNRFKSERDRRMYESLLRRDIKGVNRMINRYIRLIRTGEIRVSRRARGKMSNRAKERGAGERLREYWFKKGEENPNARKIRVIDTKTGLSQVVLVSQVQRITGGSRVGIWKAIKEGITYKERYVLTSLGSKDQAKRGNYKGTIVEDLG